jgi:hypothetical protein
MSAIVPKVPVRDVLKVALVACWLLAQAGVSAEHLSSRCRTSPRTLLSSISSISSIKQPRFCLQASLRQHGAVRTKITSASATAASTIAPTFSLDLDTSVESSPVIRFASDFDNPGLDRSAARLKLESESTLPHLLSWLDGWRMDIERGLFRPLRLRASRFAFAYTDIFDTRGHPDKGSHGLGFLFRYDFRKAPDRL